MGHTQATYLGPFAECLIEDRLFTDELAIEISEVLDWNGGVSLPPSVILDGVTHHRYCFMPQAIRPGGPGRPLRLRDTDTIIVSFDVLDIQKEVEWFAESYRPELDGLAARLGRAGVIRWGLLKWVW